MRKKKSENLVDPSPDAYTPTETLGQVALGNMDPKEAGVTQPIPIIGTEETVSPEKLDSTGPIPIIGESKPKTLPDRPPERVFGDKVEFQGGVVPLRLRAEWEKQESKIIPFDIEGWMQDNKNTHRVQALVACGNGLLRLDQTYNDPVKGLCAIMREAADKLEAAYVDAQSQNEQTEENTKGSLILHSS